MPVKSPIRKITVWPQILELRSFVQHDGVPEVEVGRGRIGAELDAQRLPLRDAGRELLRPALRAGSTSTVPRQQEAPAARRDAHALLLDLLKSLDARGAPGLAGRRRRIAPCTIERPLGHLEAHRHLREEPAQRPARDFTPITESIGPHMPASVMIRGAARQDALVRGLHVRVAADHGRYPAGEIPAHGPLLGGRLGVHVDEDHVAPRAPIAAERTIRGRERAVDAVHEHAADQVDDARPASRRPSRCTVQPAPGLLPGGKLAGRSSRLACSRYSRICACAATRGCRR